MTREEYMQVVMLIIEWMMANGYYDPADSNEPVQLLGELTDYMFEIGNGETSDVKQA